MWYEILYRVLSIINYVVLILVAIPLLWQIICVLFSFVKKKTYKHSAIKSTIAYLIPAHNEESVIYSTVKSILEHQLYPSDKFDVFVVADNCTDKTAKLASDAGAIVLIHNDSDPDHHRALYPLRFGMDYIMHKCEKHYDMIIHLDADNHINDQFSSLYNDAYQEGVDFARPFEGGLNSTQNFFTKACTMFYAFDSRYGARLRERLHLAAHINGAGAMMSTKMLEKTGGYDSVTISDDTEYFLNRLFDGIHGHYIEDAIVYEDMPSSLKDTISRNQRIGNGGTELLKPKLLKLISHFFKTGDFSCIEIFQTYIFLFIATFLCIWLPIYYIYHFTFLAFAGYGSLPVSFKPIEYYQSSIWNTLIVIGIVVAALFFIFGYLQAFILVMTEYKKLGAKKRSQLLPAVFLFPVFLLLYGITVGLGSLTKPKSWTSAKRNAPPIDLDIEESRKAEKENNVESNAQTVESNSATM